MFIRLTQNTPRWLCLYFLLTVCVSPAALAAENDRPFNALLLYGSGGIATWTHNFNENLRNELGPELGQHFTPEFLSLISSSREDRELIARSLALKYSNREIHLVIAVLTEANSFVHEFRHLFAPDAATLHVLPGTDVLSEIGHRTDEAIVASAFDPAAINTIELVPQIFPSMEHLYVVGGAGVGDASYMSRYREVAASVDTELNFHYLSGLPTDDLIAELSDAPANSAAVMTTYDVDSTGQLSQSHRVTALMSESLELPVFGMTDTHPPVGAIGGNITTTGAYARSTADVVAGIIAGQFPERPVTAGTEYMFNGRQLDRFNVNRNLLPSDAIVVNDTSNLWRDYPGWIASGVGIILFQLALIALMLAARRRSRIAEEALNRTHKMEALGTLAGGIAHDFNNILMSIMANTELANMQIDDREKIKDRLGKIQSASGRAEHLVSQILMFSRQSQQQELKSIQLCALLEDSIENIRSLTPADCEIIFHCSAPDAVVETDTNQLHQVFTNLCINAQHAMEGNGTIEISVNEIEVERTQNFLNQEIPAGRYVEMKFADTGSGIDPSDLRHVFEPFFTTKPLGKGTGLGLALVYQIIKAHSGYIDIQSAPHRGTTVSVLLHSSDGKQRKETILPGVVIKGQDQHILLVDDDDMVLDANSDNLKSLGYRVTSFNSSVAALKYFEENAGAIDLLLTDLSMPEMDGVRLISNVRQIRPQLPVILCTGYLDALQPPDISDLQVVNKPFSIPEISEALHESLRESAAH